MIENEELGLKVAENSEEELFIKFKSVTEENLKRAEQDVILYRAMIEMANNKISK